MASRLDPREVLAYLNELGYRNITANQLKDFMHDLKKLIKYEERRLENFENTSLKFSYDGNLPSPAVCAPTECMKRKKKGIVAVEIKDSVLTCHCGTQNKNKLRVLDSYGSTINQSNTYCRCGTSSKEPSETSSSGSAGRAKSCEPHISKSTTTIKLKGNMKSKASFILPREPVKNFKTDPVALYHKYQRGWQKLNFPGETSHSQLRWAVRGHMLGQPSTMSAASSMDVIPKRSRTR